MANTQEDFQTAHDKSQLLLDKQKEIDELIQWKADLDSDVASISVKLTKELTGGNSYLALFITEPTFAIQTSLKEPLKTAIDTKIATLNIEIETLKDEIEALVVP